MVRQYLLTKECEFSHPGVWICHPKVVMKLDEGQANTCGAKLSRQNFSLSFPAERRLRHDVLLTRTLHLLTLVVYDGKGNSTIVHLHLLLGSIDRNRKVSAGSADSHWAKWKPLVTQWQFIVSLWWVTQTISPTHRMPSIPLVPPPTQTPRTFAFLLCRLLHYLLCPWSQWQELYLKCTGVHTTSLMSAFVFKSWHSGKNKFTNAVIKCVICNVRY